MLTHQIELWPFPCEKRHGLFYESHLFAGSRRYASTTTANLVAFSQYSYDEFGRLSYIDHTSLGNYAETFGYAYDGAGRLASFSSALDGYSVDYAYDGRRQLLEADYTGGPTDEEYEYDENGNRINGGFTVDTNNRLLSDGTYTYEYDNEGNRTKRTEIATGDYTVYTWDHRNRLAAVFEANVANTVTSFITNSYDAFNQWTHRVSDFDGNPGTTNDQHRTLFVHDDGQIVLQFSKGGSGAVTSSHLSHRYLWAAAVDQLLADESLEDGETLWAMTDHLGSVRDIVDDNGTLRKHIQYDSFGNITDEDFFDTSGDPISAAHSEAIAQLFGYTGRILDRATGLQNNLHRWYDPTVGRWLSEDPLGFVAGDANLYRYVGNGATMGVDPYGLAQAAPPDAQPWKGQQAVKVGSKPLPSDHRYGYILILSPTPIDQRILDEFNRILADAIQRHADPRKHAIIAVQGGSGGKSTEWLKEHGLLGRERISKNEIGYKLHFHPRDKRLPRNALAHTGGHGISYVPERIREYTQTSGQSSIIVMGGTLAHESVIHGIVGYGQGWLSGTSTHPDKSGYIDSQEPDYGGVLSPTAIKLLFDKLNIPFHK